MAVVSNSGQNFTLYYNLLEYFKTIMSNHPSIAQVSQGDVFGIDDVQFPYYPLGNVLITEATFGTNVTEYQVQLTVADKVKLKSNDSSGSFNEQTVPFYNVDDVVDIHANTLAILNDLTSYTQRSQQAFQILDDIVCTPFVDKFDNGLAGWVSNFTVTTHNDKNMCLFDLNPIAPTTTTTTTSGPTTTTTSTTAAPTTTTTTTSGPTTTTTTLTPTCTTSELAVMKTPGGQSNFSTLLDACNAVNAGGLTTLFGNLWIDGNSLNANSFCSPIYDQLDLVYTNQGLTVPATYNPIQPYTLMANITYGYIFVAYVEYTSGQTKLTPKQC